MLFLLGLSFSSFRSTWKSQQFVQSEKKIPSAIYLDVVIARQHIVPQTLFHFIKYRTCLSLLEPHPLHAYQLDGSEEHPLFTGLQIKGQPPTAADDIISVRHMLIYAIYGHVFHRNSQKCFSSNPGCMQLFGV